MNRSLSRQLVGAAMIAALCVQVAGAADVVCSGPPVVLPDICSNRLEPPRISCLVPGNVQGELRGSNQETQRATDLFSWQLLIGLNWPAKPNERGVPDERSKPTIENSQPRVWETWKEIREVFRQDASGKPIKPAEWGHFPSTPTQCGTATRVLFRSAKVADVLDSNVQPTGSQGNLPVTLTDQRGELVRYEIRLNRTAFEYIATRGLWDALVQYNVDQMEFPSGAILVKAAWLPVEGRQSRFQTTEACVCDKDPSEPGAQCDLRQMGLVGFHVMSKIPPAPQWIWSTFEQVDNVGKAGATFWRPCLNCAVNRQTRPGLPNQVQRTTPIPSTNPDCNKPDEAADNVQALNLHMQAALRDTPLQFYELINTQWPLPAASRGPHTVFQVLPPLLANTTLESFIQPTSSCMGCHAMARTQRPSRFVSADFSFTLNDAYPVLPDPTVLPGPDCKTPKAIETAACFGERIANQTYELLPDNARASLHCSSCHLQAGRKAGASWWGGAIRRWDENKGYPGGIAQRINSCFQNSLNGEPLCSPTNKRCPDSPVMTSLIAYMEWIDRKAAATNTHFPPGFPALPVLAGNAANGKAVFLQKCAFCHGAEGEGRYLDGHYYRPALWGDHSFNTSAGMDSQSDLAPFIHANMPYMSGGALTPQEAWDLAAFIDGMPRPVSLLPRNPVSAGIEAAPQRTAP